MNGAAIAFCVLFAALGRYQSIVDRMPFGEPPPNFDPTATPGRSGAGAAAAAGEMTEEQRTEEEKKLAAAVESKDRARIASVQRDYVAFVRDHAVENALALHPKAVGDTYDSANMKGAFK